MAGKLTFDLSNPRKKITGEVALLLEEIREQEQELARVPPKMMRAYLACFVKGMSRKQFFAWFDRATLDEIDQAWADLWEVMENKAVPLASEKPSGEESSPDGTPPSSAVGSGDALPTPNSPTLG